MPTYVWEAVVHRDVFAMKCYTNPQFTLLCFTVTASAGNHINTLTHKQTNMHTNTQTCTQTHKHTNKQTCTQTHKHAHKHTNTQTCTQPNTNKHTNNLKQIVADCSWDEEHNTWWTHSTQASDKTYRQKYIRRTLCSLHAVQQHREDRTSPRNWRPSWDELLSTTKPNSTQI